MGLLLRLQPLTRSQPQKDGKPFANIISRKVVLYTTASMLLKILPWRKKSEDAVLSQK